VYTAILLIVLWISLYSDS